ncbi:DUF924 family protein [Pseudemcibacter aquimaris]|uniref:DUF924 family protein n=1 Tax=Pseudemcibacter aquimaris TaxID=2857064 RepID=UPI0020133AF1|nr:DUF924 family protein [Pseudemcibacter aquimaris]MCC3859642.1 DUF924 domain-containing protein [Pseudemcibacter aquimaris]WDU60037.1 DUF924 domain-containing protein [Pseudemcibacter aquimaris]
MAKKKAPVTAKDVIDFWFNELTPQDWWKKSTALDKKIKTRFHDIYKRAAAGELVSWRYDPLDSLAEIIILDQFPRNMFRDKKQSFATDPLALVLAQSAVDKGYDQKLNNDQKSFLYMPFMHSESAEIHRAAELLFSAPGLEHNYDFELKHKAIIDRFGRYPHRNKILGRRSRKEEIEFLKEPGSSF